MRRLGRILWTAFAAASLLCCAAAAGVWVRSYFVADGFEQITITDAKAPNTFVPALNHDFRTVVVSGGRAAFVRGEGWVEGILGVGGDGWEHYAVAPASLPLGPEFVRAQRWDVSFAGIAYLGEGEPGGRTQVLVLHLTYPTALFALAPLAWFVGHRKRRRRAARARAGLCARCGYDLRGSPNRCPECGACP